MANDKKTKKEDEKRAQANLSLANAVYEKLIVIKMKLDAITTDAKYHGLPMSVVSKMDESLKKMSDIGKDVAAIRGGNAQTDISHGLVSHVEVKKFFQKIETQAKTVKQMLVLVGSV